MTSANRRHGSKSAVMTSESRPPPVVVRRDSLSARTMRDGKNIDIGGVKPLVTRTEIHCGRTSNARTNAGKPAYKSQEEQYQEIQELRRHLSELREDHSGLKTRCRRLEEDLIRRDRQIEQLMDPAKNDEARRKLTDKGASLVSSLKLRVSRLEATLKDKEAELAKLQASAKATALNELKIEAETYYQEVIRLRNQLNVAQQQQQYQQYPKHNQQYSPRHMNTQSQQYPQQHSQPQPQPHLQPPTPEAKLGSADHWSNMRGGRESREAVHGQRDGGDGQEAPATSLRHALTQLEEENARLGQQLSTLTTEKNKLMGDMERVLGLSEDVKNNYEGMNRVELIREVERRQEELNRLESQHSQLTEALARRHDLAEDSSALLQARVSELQGREVEWERERSSMRELINTLKDDRMFYKEAAQKKDSELEDLRTEVQSLQQEVISLHNTQRRSKDHAAHTNTSQRTPRGSARPVAANASRSGSSSEANTPTRRSRPSSARPPTSSSRPPRPAKASSEPRETRPPNRTPRSTTQQNPKRPPPVRASSKPPSSTSSPSKTSAVSARTATSTTRQSTSRRTTSSSSTSTPKASPFSSPKHSSTGRTASATSSRGPTPMTSPRKPAGSVSPQRKTRGPSPQSKSSGLSSPVKAPTPRSSSRTSTASSASSAKSSPSKKSTTPTPTPNRSPSKSSPTKGGASPNKTGKRREESASPIRSPRSVKKDVIRESSAEEDERILAEILFHREMTSSDEASDTPSLARQRTMTLSVHEETTPGQEEEEAAGSGGSLVRQNTVTLDKSEDEEAEATNQEESCSQMEKTASKEINSQDSVSKSLELGSADEKEIIENLELLQSLLSSHLSRQHQVNKLLSQEPLLVGEGHRDADSPEASRGRGRRTRESPDGEESARGSSNRSHSLVRQGTFNIYEQETPVAAIHATLDAHITRVNKVHQFSTK